MSWLKQIEALKPGDACEFQWPARSTWQPGEVVVNGGSGYWHVKLTEDYHDTVNNELIPAGTDVTGIYIEHVRLPGQEEAWARP